MPTITGTPGNDTLEGTSGADLIEGLAGDDTLLGRGGIDTTDGGPGNDVHLVEDAGDIVIEDAGEGDDIVVARVSYVLGAGVQVETMTTISAFGTEAINLTGNELSQSIYGNAGNNILDGGGGADFLLGLGGNDSYIVDSPSDTVAEAAGDGDDEVIASVSYALAAGAWVETLRTNNAASTADLTLSGNEVANSIYGNAGDNVLSGGGGNDYLVGLEGNDYLVGGGGTDAMLGGTGNDTYTIDLAVGDTVSVQEQFGFTNWTIVAVGDGQTITVSQTAIGGGTTTRTFQVGQLYAGDNVLESANEGEDVIVASTSYALRSGISVETLVAADSSAGITLRGNDLANSIYGNAGANLLFGGTGADFLVGLAGNDTLDGESGADTMAGGTGNDTFIIDNVSDRLVENVGEGFDTVEIRLPGNVAFTLAPGVEVETLVRPPGFFTGLPTYTVGNEFTQTIVGNEGFNRLAGGGGADTLNGQGGDDIYDISDGGETIVEGAGGGTDTAYVSTNYTLSAAAQVETISTYWQFGNGGFDITGNAFAQTIVGDFGSNVLDSKGGDDTLIGLGGADTFMFSTTFGGNADTIADFESGIDTIALSHAIFDTLAPGDLDPEAFAIGGAATEADDRIIYDPTTGNLFYDADGSGSGSAVVIATLTGVPVVQATDFAVI